MTCLGIGEALAEGKISKDKASRLRTEMIEQGRMTARVPGLRVFMKERRQKWCRVLVADARGRKLNGGEWWVLNSDVEPVEVAEAPKRPAQAVKQTPAEKQAIPEKPEVKQAERQAPRKAEERPGKVFNMKAEEDAANNLAYVKRLLKRGETEKAHHRLEEILRDWPSTEAAKEAQTLLTKLLKEESAAGAPRK
jgi:hypothetical protein